MKRSTLALAIVLTGIVGVANAAQHNPGGKQASRTASSGSYAPVTARGQAAGQIIRTWAGYVQKIYGTSPQAWAQNMQATFAQADLANMQKAAKMQTYEAMMGTLVGQQTSDAKVITALAKSDGSLSAVQALGSPSEDLVYTMVNPCRIVDTRVAGGPIAGGFTRSFNSSGANFVAQGGANSTCGIPSDISAAVFNVTVVSPINPGFVTVYPFNTVRPNASSLNYKAGDVIGNELVAKQSLALASDFTVYTHATTDVVIDIVGYFMAPNATALDCVETASSTGVSIPSLGNATIFAPACDAGYTAVSGSCDSDGVDMRMVETGFSGNAFFCEIHNAAGVVSNSFQSARSRCCRVPGR